MNWEDLVGAHIKRATIADGVVYAETDGGVVKFEPDGECCAHAYIQHVSYSDALVDATVLRVDWTETESTGDVGESVEDRWIQRIHTTRGTCSIEMRVDHNGFYSGSLNVGRARSVPKNATALEDF